MKEKLTKFLKLVYEARSIRDSDMDYELKYELIYSCIDPELKELDMAPSFDQVKYGPYSPDRVMNYVLELDETAWQVEKLVEDLYRTE